MTIKVVIAEDQSMVLGALAALLEIESDVQVVGQARNGREALQLTLQLKPNVLLTDIEMPEMTGLEVATELKQRGSSTRIIILTTFARPGYLRRAMEAGAAGYLLKDAPAATLANALRRVNAGHRVIDPELATEAWTEKDPLSDRERQVLQLVAEGKTTKELASILGISAKTAESHRSNIMDKLDIHDVAGLVRYAIRTGIIQS